MIERLVSGRLAQLASKNPIICAATLMKKRNPFLDTPSSTGAPFEKFCDGLLWGVQGTDSIAGLHRTYGLVLV